MNETRTFTLSEEEANLLTQALGTAAGIASRARDIPLFHALLRLANHVNEGHPKWRPYRIEAEPEEVKPTKQPMKPLARKPVRKIVQQQKKR